MATILSVKLGADLFLFLFMLPMVKGSRGDLKKLFDVLKVAVTSFCIIHVDDGKEISC
ncbi:uncharacterized protein BX664DRAFT_349095 [Halteromyces radiatus]|uniref:uncharacterized protein n=1 Tax=Halteromyces radiatus TaxID=101107 RepID=UPI0022207F46|nr:uncharacterized protein BX664DRAFT_353960 [Halteromyces radiatus]XP_051402375.1 uncharacterized protein BX664DRAFT_349095 [Halteromyces radiatus]KAI8076373.1 hypothetical protein BX664DRAFT_353960 [Halteromyces radiatus]KAI8093924.1 hypothetical protein BX664DRAFT_349095 [Halteromyces radiatus]